MLFGQPFATPGLDAIQARFAALAPEGSPDRARLIAQAVRAAEGRHRSRVLAWRRRALAAMRAGLAVLLAAWRRLLGRLTRPRPVPLPRPRPVRPPALLPRPGPQPACAQAP